MRTSPVSRTRIKTGNTQSESETVQVRLTNVHGDEYSAPHFSALLIGTCHGDSGDRRRTGSSTWLLCGNPDGYNRGERCVKNHRNSNRSNCSSRSNCSNCSNHMYNYDMNRNFRDISPAPEARLSRGGWCRRAKVW